MKSSTKQLLIGVGGAVAAGLILHKVTGRGGGGYINPEFVSGAPYGNSPAPRTMTAAFRPPSQPAPTSKAAAAAPRINVYPTPTYRGRNPYNWGFSTMNADGSGGAMI